ncbi:MAG TPA: polyamine ABC transporter substrate-binding protein [Steroidobacteraceae bacterium]|nr:polyamine ABC transporter substrate-binding protein [Steroidobacteraceae bacterium]
MRCLSLAAAPALALLLAACGGSPQPGTTTAGPPETAAGGPEEKVLNIYNWSDYIAPDLVQAFAREYGIKVNYDVYDSNSVLETKLLTGKSGYDIVVPTAAFLAREIPAGAFRRLDPSLIPNARNIDAGIRRQTGLFDPGLAHSVNYLMSTSGIGYNAAKIAAAMPDAPLDSLRMVFDPTVVSRFGKCGVQFIDAPDEVVNTVLLYLGRRPNSDDPADLAAAGRVLMRIRPYVRSIETETYIEALANGDVCLVLGWSGDVGQAATRAREARNGNTIRYVIPREGAMLYFDLFAIPADAAHWRNAHLFMNYMLRADVAARNANFLRYATTNAAARPMIEPQLRDDPNLYPPPDTMARLVPDLPRSQAYTRALTRMWTRFKAGS